MSNSNLDIYRRARTKEALEAYVKARAGRSTTKRKEAVQRAITMPNSLPARLRPTSPDGRG